VTVITMANFIGRSLGHYHILEQLGKGGMATVNTRLERDAAVKVIRKATLISRPAASGKS
jgi:hypothetical protein